MKNNVFLDSNTLDFEDFWRTLEVPQRLAIIDFVNVYLNDFVQGDGRIVIPYYGVECDS